MTGQIENSTYALTGATIALLLSVCCSSAFASNGLKTRCSEVIDELSTAQIPVPSLNVEVADHGLIDAPADMNVPATEASAEKISPPALAEIATATSSEGSENDESDDNDAVPDSEPPETALRLPGVSKDDQPRFRRQMYRTDI